MKPKNFPERVDERRRAALAHLLLSGKRPEEAAKLQDKIKNDARSVRTKKDRSNRGK